MRLQLPPWAPWLALAALAVIPYLRALDAPLLNDDRTVLSSPWLAKDADAVSVFGAGFFKGTRHEGAGPDLYRPVTSLTLAWSLRYAGSRAGIHGVNLLLHALAALTAARLLLRVFRGAPSVTAWAGAALFAVHPLASEAVLSAVGRAEILALILGAAAFLLFLDALEGRGARGFRYPLSLLLFFLALGSKESAVAWLPIGALGAVLLRREARPAPWRRAAALGAGYAAVLGAFLVLRARALGPETLTVPFVDNPLVLADPATRAANAVLLLGRYAAKALVPRVLTLEYGFDQIAVVPLRPWGWAAALALAVGFAAVWVALLRASKPAAFLWAFFPVAFAATSNVAFPIGTIFAERLAYLPLAAACGIAAWALARATASPAIRAAALAGAVVLLAARGWVRAGDYRDLATFREATAQASPRSVKALYNVGRLRLRQGRAPAAAEALERAVAIWPDYAAALDLLSQAYAAEGLADRAEDARRRAREAAARAATREEPDAPEDPRGGMR